MQASAQHFACLEVIYDTPKGMRSQRFLTTAGDAVHIYSDKDRLILQLRHEVPSETDLLACSFKAAVELSEEDALAIAGELLTAISLRKKNSQQQGKLQSHE